MKCQELNEYFDDYILGEVDPALEIRINEHLPECSKCRAEVEEKERLTDYFTIKTSRQPPADAYRKIKDRIFLPGRVRKPFWASYTVRLAALSAAFVFGMILMRVADVVALRSKNEPGIETKARPYYRVPYSDTVQFYAAPAKNLAKI